jgi:hypothetical protein
VNAFFAAKPATREQKLNRLDFLIMLEFGFLALLALAARYLS